MASEEDKKATGLAQWIYQRTDPWEKWRDTQYKDRWDSYYRSFRGFWIEQDKLNEAERSRLVPPELSQAIETMVAEIEEATFIRERWIDLIDDVSDEDPSDIEGITNIFLEDMDEAHVADAVSEAILNSAIFGTGILKIAVVKEKHPKVDTTGTLPGVIFEDVYVIKAVPISPRNFVIEPSASRLDDAVGCAHIFRVPLNVVQRRISDGTYYPETQLQEFSHTVEDTQSLGELEVHGGEGNGCKVTEWHGLVPKDMLKEYTKKKESSEYADVLGDQKTLDTTIESTKDYASDDLVEAIVTIINDTSVAKCVENPFLMGDRSVVAFQFDTVPNRFWGRGVGEKGYNSQKGLEAEIRARIDALKLSTHPMMGIDATKVPRGEKFGVKAGRNILTRGNPAEALMPLKFPPPDPHTFQQSQELREMLQRGTGAYDLPSQMANANRMAATSMSMVVGSMIKRSKRTLANVERGGLRPLVQKMLWRNMQFNPNRYPLRDYKFKVRGSMGIMAREFEQGQMVSLLSTVPGESPAFWMLMKGIYENSNIDDREEMIKFAESKLEQSQQPPPPNPEVELKKQELEFKMQEHKDKMNIDVRKLEHRDIEIRAEAKRDEGEGRMQTATSVLQLVKAESEGLSKQAKAMVDIATANEKKEGIRLKEYELALEELKIAVSTMSSSRSTETAAYNASSPAGTQVWNFPEIKTDAQRSEEEEAEVAKNETIVAGIQNAIFQSMPKGEPVDEAKIAELLSEVTVNSRGEKEQVIQAITAMKEQMARQGDSQQGEEEMVMQALASMREQISQQGLSTDSKLDEAAERGAKQQQQPPQAAPPAEPQDLTSAIERGSDGLVSSIAGRPAVRDSNGRLKGIT